MTYFSFHRVFVFNPYFLLRFGFLFVLFWLIGLFSFLWCGDVARVAWPSELVPGQTRLHREKQQQQPQRQNKTKQKK